jgi:hypothetical protein
MEIFSFKIYIIEIKQVVKKFYILVSVYDQNWIQINQQLCIQMTFKAREMDNKKVRMSGLDLGNSIVN